LGFLVLGSGLLLFVLAYGFFNSSIGLLSLPAPWLGAALREKFSPQTPFMITALAMFLSSGLAYLKLRLPAKEAGLLEEA
jgi:hypothetical protein